MPEQENTGPKSGRRQMLRFIACFVLCLVLGFGLLLAPFTQPAMGQGTIGEVKLCAGLVRLFGGHAAARENVLVNPANGFSIEVRDTCNASNVTLLLWAAILSFPAPWIQKGKGLAAGTVAIHTLNLVRIISLFYLGQYNTQWFTFAHLYVWESLIMLVTLIVFSVWVQGLRFSSRTASPPCR
jgi:exosortase H (IPTLxxWG-CTERM-specific)